MKYNAAKLEQRIARDLLITKEAFKKAYPALSRIRKRYPNRSKENQNEHSADIIALLQMYTK